MTATRRMFLQSSLIAMSLPLSARLHTESFSELRRLRVVTEAVCDDTRRFMRMCGPCIEVLGVEPLRSVPSLEDDLRSHRIEVLFGLTSDSSRFIAEQVALQYGFRRDYLGIHDFRYGRLTHLLEGHAGFVDAVGDAGYSYPASWIDAMAASLALLSSPDAAVKRRLMDRVPTQYTDSPGYLVSWSLRRG